MSNQKQTTEEERIECLREFAHTGESPIFAAPTPSRAILLQVLEALQLAETIAWEGPEYAKLMDAIIAECAARRQFALEK